MPVLQPAPRQKPRPTPAQKPRPIPSAVRDAVLAWYRRSGRVLPFRATRDPYAILVSEVMAQQTQIDRVAEAWTRFLERFPTMESLAAAAPADVLRQWRGMGYNRRALNLHRLARAVVADHGGQLPRDIDALIALPGIGPYTSRAVAALAFDARVGAVDTNVRRVIGRIADTDSGPAIQALADGLVPADTPGEWTHALMDVGATFCRPRTPHCPACPAAAWCAYARGRQARTSTGQSRSAGRAKGPGSDAAVRFDRTTRWLRGRILDRLRDAEAGAWVRFHGPIGSHGSKAVGDAIVTLADEGLLEHDPASPGRARLPLS